MSSPEVKLEDRKSHIFNFTNFAFYYRRLFSFIIMVLVACVFVLLVNNFYFDYRNSNIDTNHVSNNDLTVTYKSNDMDDEIEEQEELDFLHGNTINEWKSPKFRVISKKYIKHTILDNEKFSKKQLTVSEFQKQFYISYSNFKFDGSDYPGKNGASSKSPIPENGQEYKNRYNLYQFNEPASSQIPLLRELPPHLNKQCTKRTYPVDLPNASIIIVHHNEAESVLLRTVHSVYANSPYYLIKEVILVDDATDLNLYKHLTRENMYEKLKMFPSVIYIRSEERIGLIDARLLGAKKATGDVLVFLDSHCECFSGWLEPLLHGIMLNPRASITPVIETISYENFNITATKDPKSVGIFDWGMNFRWSAYDEKFANSNKPFLLKSPTMAGGLLAIGNKFFFDIGSYDQEMKLWGSENLEMSFRLWTCADGIYVDICSHVGHVFRKTSPHHLSNEPIRNNKIRLVEVWLDEYKEKFYKKSGDPKLTLNISNRIELRERLKCKPFKWYVENIAMYYLPGMNNKFEGKIRNPTSNMCFDSYGMGGSDFDLKFYQCHSIISASQLIEYSSKGELLINSDKCLDSFSNQGSDKPIKWSTCHGGKGNQHWIFTKDKQIKLKNSNDCITYVKNDSNGRLLTCNSDDINQKWSLLDYKNLDHIDELLNIS